VTSFSPLPSCADPLGSINPVIEQPFASKDTFPRTYFRSFGKMGMFFTKLFDRLTSKKESRILMVRRPAISSSGL